GHRRPAALALLIAGVMAAGCYKPKILDGGLLCAVGADGGVCPEGYYCAANGVCNKGDPMACDGAPKIPPICTPDPGIDCGAICQSRCDCGRCNLVEKALKCTTVGAKATGEFCTAAADDCAPGNICLGECGGKVARCYRFCGNGDSVMAGVCQGQAC